MTGGIREAGGGGAGAGALGEEWGEREEVASGGGPLGDEIVYLSNEGLLCLGILVIRGH